MAGTVVPTTALGEELRVAIDALGLGRISDVEILHGGSLSRVNRVTTASAARLVAKHGGTAAADLFAREADGLNAIRSTGVRAPEVLRVEADWLLLEDIPNDKTVAPNDCATSSRSRRRRSPMATSGPPSSADPGTAISSSPPRANLC